MILTLDQIAAREADLYLKRTGGGYLLRPHRSVLIAQIRRNLEARQAAEEIVSFTVESEEAPNEDRI